MEERQSRKSIRWDIAYKYCFFRTKLPSKCLLITNTKEELGVKSCTDIIDSADMRGIQRP
jgi:hypothetical protein